MLLATDTVPKTREKGRAQGWVGGWVGEGVGRKANTVVYYKKKPFEVNQNETRMQDL